MSIQTEIERINSEVNDQEQTIIQIGAALGGKALTSRTTAPRYGNAICFGSVYSAPREDGSKALMDYVAESGAYESITTYADSSYTVEDLPGLVNEHQTDIQNADIVFLEFGMTEMNNILEGVAAGQWLAGSPSLIPRLTDTGGETLCAALYTGLFNIKAVNPTARIVWLQPMRWSGYSETLISSMLDDESLGDGYESLIAEINLAGDALLLLEATLLRVVRNCGGSIVDLGMSSLDQMFASDDFDPTEMLAQAVISNPFRNVPAPALQRTISARMTELTTGTAFVAYPAMLYYMAMLDVELSMEMIPAGIPIPVKMQYAVASPFSGYPEMIFYTIAGTELWTATLSCESTDGGMPPVTLEIHNLASGTTTEKT